MSRVSKATVKALLNLINSGEIKLREFPDKDLAERLLSAGCVKKERITKSSSKLVLVHEGGLRVCCGDYDERLKNLEAYLKTFESDEKGLKPSEEIARFGRDHLSDRNLWRGFFMKANIRLIVSYNGHAVTIDPDTPLLVEKPEMLEARFEDLSLWVVENYECFLNLSWMKLFPTGNEPSLIICRWPASKQARITYGSWPVLKKYYFGDLDLAGINIFQTEYASLFGEDALCIPQSFPNDISHGSGVLFHRQMKFLGIKGKTKRIQECIEMIIKSQKGLLQEFYITGSIPQQ